MSDIDHTEEEEAPEPEQFRARRLEDLVADAERLRNKMAPPRSIEEIMGEADYHGGVEVAEGYNVTEDEALEAIGLMNVVKRRLKDLVNEMEIAVIYWILVNGRDIQMGDKRWYIGAEKLTRCLSVRDTLDAALTAAGGDFDQVAQVLSASAFKPAATRTLIGADADKFFLTYTVPDLKTGRPRKRLKQTDTRFFESREG